MREEIVTLQLEPHMLGAHGTQASTHQGSEAGLSSVGDFGATHCNICHQGFALFIDNRGRQYKGCITCDMMGVWPFATDGIESRQGVAPKHRDCTFCSRSS